MVTLLFYALLFGYCSARPQYAALLPNGNSNPNIAHVNPSGTGPRNLFAMAFAANQRVWDAALCRLDSDDDGYSNGIELGDPNCTWMAGNPTVSGPTVSQPGVATSMPMCDVSVMIPWPTVRLRLTVNQSLCWIGLGAHNVVQRNTSAKPFRSGDINNLTVGISYRFTFVFPGVYFYGSEANSRGDMERSVAVVMPATVLPTLAPTPVPTVPPTPPATPRPTAAPTPAPPPCPPTTTTCDDGQCVTDPIQCTCSNLFAPYYCETTGTCAANCTACPGQMPTDCVNSSSSAAPPVVNSSVCPVETPFPCPGGSGGACVALFTLTILGADTTTFSDEALVLTSRIVFVACDRNASDLVVMYSWSSSPNVSGMAVGTTRSALTIPPGTLTPDTIYSFTVIGYAADPNRREASVSAFVRVRGRAPPLVIEGLTILSTTSSIALRVVSTSGIWTCTMHPNCLSVIASQIANNSTAFSSPGPLQAGIYVIEVKDSTSGLTCSVNVTVLPPSAGATADVGIIMLTKQITLLESVRFRAAIGITTASVSLRLTWRLNGVAQSVPTDTREYAVSPSGLIVNAWNTVTVSAWGGTTVSTFYVSAAPIGPATCTIERLDGMLIAVEAQSTWLRVSAPGWGNGKTYAFEADGIPIVASPSRTLTCRAPYVAKTSWVTFTVTVTDKVSGAKGVSSCAVVVNDLEVPDMADMEALWNATVIANNDGDILSVAREFAAHLLTVIKRAAMVNSTSDAVHLLALRITTTVRSLAQFADRVLLTDFVAKMAKVADPVTADVLSTIAQEVEGAPLTFSEAQRVTDALSFLSRMHIDTLETIGKAMLLHDTPGVVRENAGDVVTRIIDTLLVETPSAVLAGRSGKVTVPRGAFPIADAGTRSEGRAGSGLVGIIMTTFRTVGDAYASNDTRRVGKFFASGVISLRFTNDRRGGNGAPIQMEFPLTDVSGATCVFWNGKTQQWDQGGMTLVATKLAVQCVCTQQAFTALEFTLLFAETAPPPLLTNASEGLPGNVTSGPRSSASPSKSSNIPMVVGIVVCVVVLATMVFCCVSYRRSLIVPDYLQFDRVIALEKKWYTPNVCTSQDQDGEREMVRTTRNAGLTIALPS